MHLAEHLTDDHLDVLVVDGHALRSVDLLHLVYLEHLQRLDPLHAELLVGVDRPLGELLAHLDPVAVGHGQPGPE